MFTNDAHYMRTADWASLLYGGLGISFARDACTNTTHHHGPLIHKNEKASLACLKISTDAVVMEFVTVRCHHTTQRDNRTNDNEGCCGLSAVGTH